MAKVASPASQQLLHIEPASDADEAGWPCHRAGADPLTLHFVFPEWT